MSSSDYYAFGSSMPNSAVGIKNAATGNNSSNSNVNTPATPSGDRLPTGTPPSGTKGKGNNNLTPTTTNNNNNNNNDSPSHGNSIPTNKPRTATPQKEVRGVGGRKIETLNPAYNKPWLKN